MSIEKDELSNNSEPSQPAVGGNVSDVREQFRRLRERARTGEILRDHAQANVAQREAEIAYLDSHPWDRSKPVKYWDEPPVPVEDSGPKRETSAIRRVKGGPPLSGAFQDRKSVV